MLLLVQLKTQEDFVLCTCTVDFICSNCFIGLLFFCLGPLPTTLEGFKYVLTFTDYFSKFVEFFPLKSKEAAGVASRIQTFVWRWGAPKRLISDQGREFVAKVSMFSLPVLHSLQICKRKSSLSTSQLNSITYKRYLKKFIIIYLPTCIYGSLFQIL